MKLVEPSGEFAEFMIPGPQVARSVLIEAARKYLGVRFRHQGRDRDGLDCVGLPFRVAYDSGLTSFRYETYQERPDGRTVLDIMQKLLVRVLPTGERIMHIAHPGDILLFEWTNRPCHVGIVTDLPGTGVIHAHLANRSVVEHRVTDEWWEHVAGVFQFPRVAPWPS